MDTRKEIVAFATTLLKQNGFHGWSYENLSKKVDIKKASIHYHFPTKDSLVLEVLEIYIKDLFKSLDYYSKTPGKCLDKLRRMINLYRLNYEAKNEICLCTILASDYQTISPEIRACLEKFFKALLGWITNVLRQGVNEREFKANLPCETVAYLLINTLQGLLITSHLFEDKKVFDLCVEQIFSSLK